MESRVPPDQDGGRTSPPCLGSGAAPPHGHDRKTNRSNSRITHWSMWRRSRSCSQCQCPMFMTWSDGMRSPSSVWGNICAFWSRLHLNP